MNLLSQNFPEIQKQAGLSDINSMTPTGLLKSALPYLFGIIGFILLFNIIASGFKMLVSANDPKAMSLAQAKIYSSILGVVIMFGAFFIVQIILKFLGINFSTSLFY